MREREPVVISLVRSRTLIKLALYVWHFPIRDGTPASFAFTQ